MTKDIIEKDLFKEFQTVSTQISNLNKRLFSSNAFAEFAKNYTINAFRSPLDSSLHQDALNQKTPGAVNIENIEETEEFKARLKEESDKIRKDMDEKLEKEFKEVKGNVKCISHKSNKLYLLSLLSSNISARLWFAWEIKIYAHIK